MNGESAAAPAGFDGVAGAAFDLVFIGCCAESLDCLAGDFFFRVAALAAVAAWALGRAADFVAALVLGAALDLAPATDLAAWRPGVALPLAVDFLAAVVRTADFFGAGFFDTAFFGAAFFASCFRAADFLGAVLRAGFFTAADFFLADACRVVPFAAGFLVAAFCFGVALDLELDLPTALVFGLGGDFSVGVAAMICLWFLTCCRARELLVTPGISKGA